MGSPVSMAVSPIRAIHTASGDGQAEIDVALGVGQQTVLMSGRDAIAAHETAAVTCGACAARSLHARHSHIGTALSTSRDPTVHIPCTSHRETTRNDERR